ncbi:Na(+)/H(+) antiporter NhaA [Bienertia sinuspersici]
MPNHFIQQKVEHKTLLHEWALLGKIWPFECLLSSNDVIADLGIIFVNLISDTDDQGMSPLHFICFSQRALNNKEGAKIGKLLIDTYKQHETVNASSSIQNGEPQFPWLIQDMYGKTPLDYAIDMKDENFAKMILSEDKNALKTCRKDILFVAIENKCQDIPQMILEIVDEKGLTHLLTNDQNKNALHLAPKCKSE